MPPPFFTIKAHDYVSVIHQTQPGIVDRYWAPVSKMALDGSTSLVPRSHPRREAVKWARGESAQIHLRKVGEMGRGRGKQGEDETGREERIEGRRKEMERRRGRRQAW